MIPPEFDYYSPTGIKEAVDLLSKFGEDAKVLAGGQSLIPMLKLRVTSIPVLVSLSDIKELDYVEARRDGLYIGAMTRIADLEDSSAIDNSLAIIPQAASKIADPLVRNMGTAGGNISHADPSNDLPAVMLALGAKFKVYGKGGERVLDSRDFFLDAYTTALNRDEAVTEIIVPKWKAGSRGVYLKMRKRAADFSIAGVAVQLEFNDGEVSKAGLATTSLNPVAKKITEAEDMMTGKALNDALIDKVSNLVAESCDPASDLYGSAEFKRKLARRLTSEALLTISKMR
ncbi:xanthine dehydrogenase family protein subunit M [Thermoplasmatales archaeon AK]|nr:xanthine dehydrogenase family protein subunit M [Thermoplasmatales archaeon AK]